MWLKRRFLAFQQLRFLCYEMKQAVNRRWWRWITIWFGSGFGVIVSYRLDRFLFLLFGPPYGLLRLLFIPIFLLLGLLFGRHEIHYRADIGKGFRVLHPTLGVLVSGYTIAGERLTLTGGNCIGQRKPIQAGDILIGSRVRLGANAVVLGPVRIGDRCVIGAGVVLMNDVPADTSLVGVPAIPFRRPQESDEPA